ncbi:SRSF protein kinase 1 [Metarhizium anisopliae]
MGDVLASKYQVIRKLGFGTMSTVWFAGNLMGNREEFQVLETLGKANPPHPGYRHVSAALDIFQLHHPGGDHYFLVQRPMCMYLSNCQAGTWKRYIHHIDNSAP